jgi:hypothetical protein
MMGKLCLALSPTLPEWLHASLQLTPRGLTTGVLPYGDRSIEVTLDLTAGALLVLTSDGGSRSIPLSPARPIAGIWRDFTDSLRELGVEAPMWDKPQETSDAIPFAADGRARTYDAPSIAAWFAALTAVRNLFDEWRSPFFGRTGVGFWWGAFDMSVLLFTGRRATPRGGADFIGRYDGDAELLAIGFWPGDARHEAMFYGYIVPEPPGCARHPLNVPPARWAEKMGEWILPYEAVRTALDPKTMLQAFMDSVYSAAGMLARWDLAAYRYERPPRPSPDAARHLR